MFVGLFRQGEAILLQSKCGLIYIYLLFLFVGHYSLYFFKSFCMFYVICVFVFYVFVCGIS